MVYPGRYDITPPPKKKDFEIWKPKTGDKKYFYRKDTASDALGNPSKPRTKATYPLGGGGP